MGEQGKTTLCLWAHTIALLCTYVRGKSQDWQARLTSSIITLAVWIFQRKIFSGRSSVGISEGI